MKNIKIKKVAVVGSGIMGSRIACHLVNVGMDVLLLDISPAELNEKERKLMPWQICPFTIKCLRD